MSHHGTSFSPYPKAWAPYRAARHDTEGSGLTNHTDGEREQPRHHIVKPEPRYTDGVVFHMPSDSELEVDHGDTDFFDCPVLGCVRVITMRTALVAGADVRRLMARVLAERPDHVLLAPLVTLRTGFSLARLQLNHSVHGCPVPSISILLCRHHERGHNVIIEYLVPQPVDWDSRPHWKARLHLLLRCARLTEAVGCMTAGYHLNPQQAPASFFEPRFVCIEDRRKLARLRFTPVRDAVLAGRSE